MLTIERLNNGIQVVLEEIGYVRSISFGIWVKNGTRNERPEENGISHYIEHMMFKGTEHRSAKEIAEEMDALGGQINAYTTKEYTCYHTRVLDKHITRAMDVMSDMLLHPAFREEDVQRERNVILEEIDMYEDAPEELVHDCLQDAIWQDCSLGMPILGTEETISAFTSETIRDYYEKNYHTDNTVLSVAGNFKKEEMMALLNAYFGGWQPKAPYHPFETEAVTKQVRIHREKDVEQLHTCIAFPGLEREHPLKYALAVFQTIFGGGMSSRLFQKVREEQGLAYSIYSYTTAFADTGLFCIYASMNPAQADAVYKSIFHEIQQIRKEGVSQRLLEVTKEQMISNFIIGSESTLNRMTSAGAALLLRGEVMEMEEVIARIEAITEEDIQQVMELIFGGKEVSYSAVGNLKQADFASTADKFFS